MNLFQFYSLDSNARHLYRWFPYLIRALLNIFIKMQFYFIKSLLNDSISIWTSNFCIEGFVLCAAAAIALDAAILRAGCGLRCCVLASCSSIYETRGSNCCLASKHGRDGLIKYLKWCGHMCGIKTLSTAARATRVALTHYDNANALGTELTKKKAKQINWNNNKNSYGM